MDTRLPPSKKVSEIRAEGCRMTETFLFFYLFLPAQNSRSPCMVLEAKGDNVRSL